MLRSFLLIPSLLLLCTLSFAEQSQVKSPASQGGAHPVVATNPSPFKAFTGKIIGSSVRMRILPDLESHIVTEFSQNDYVVATGEKGDFYAVQPPSDLKAYIFRGFVIDDTVEGDRVNVRLSPNRNSPIIGHYSTGKSLKGIICDTDNKWLEISMPPNTEFFIAKEFIEYEGKPELKTTHDKRKKSVSELLESAIFLTQSEMRKTFSEIDIDRISQHYQTIIDDYADFSSHVDRAKKHLAQVQEEYLHRKITFLETKASKMGTNSIESIYKESDQIEEPLSPTDRMKIWEPLEEGLYLTWSSMHHGKTINDFYQDQALKGATISGLLEPYTDPVKNKPGDYILKNQDIPIGYLYSTHINLQKYIGKQVNLVVTKRPNNHFAFPAYYVLEVSP